MKHLLQSFHGIVTLFSFLLGTGSPRLLGKDGDALPNPRDIRLSIHEKSLPIHELKNYSLFLMQWGQRTSHDMLLKVESKGKIISRSHEHHFFYYRLYLFVTF